MSKLKRVAVLVGACAIGFLAGRQGIADGTVRAQGAALTAGDYQEIIRLEGKSRKEILRQYGKRQ